MDHNHAVEIHAVERYLLGELAPEERDSFEEHYFTCAVCAGEVRSGARFRANARDVLKEPERSFEKEPGRGWFSWAALIPITACVMLLGVVGYQNTVLIPALRMPQTLASPVTLDGVTRGSLPQVEAGRPLDLLMAAPPAGPSGVITELAAESGTVLVRSPAIKPVPEQPYRVYFPGEYRPGRYFVILRDAASGQELARNKFEIAPKETNAR
jgi:hypothetical protein